MSGTDELIRGLARKLEAEFWPEGSAAHQAQDKFERVLRESGLAEVLEVMPAIIDSEDCSYDHRGYCQKHAHLSAGLCPQFLAKTALAALRSKVVPQ